MNEPWSGRLSRSGHPVAEVAPGGRLACSLSLTAKRWQVPGWHAN